MQSTWYFHEDIKRAFIGYLKSLPFQQKRIELSFEERKQWLIVLKEALSPEDLGPNNYLKYRTWDNYFKDSPYWGLLFQVNYDERSSDFREGSRLARYPVFYLIPNYASPDDSEMVTVRRGLAHSVEALSRRQIIKKVEANDPSPTESLPLDPTLRESVAFVQDMENKIEEAYVSNKHDGSTCYLTCLHPNHPAFPAVKDLLQRVPGGFGQDLLDDFAAKGYAYLMIPGTSSQLVIAVESQMAYHGTAVLSRHGEYNGTDRPKDLLLKAIGVMFETVAKIESYLWQNEYIQDGEVLKTHSFGLMFENCVPNRTDWCKEDVHTELSMVYPKGASYLFAVWYPVTDLDAPPLDKVYGSFLPHVAMYHDLVKLKIPQPCALKVPSGEVIDRMMVFLEKQLLVPVDPEETYYDTAVKFSADFYEEFKEYFMGLQEDPMDNLISWEGFCVFCIKGGFYDYVKVKLDMYYKAHKHAMKMIPAILEHGQKNHFISIVYGSFARVILIDQITDGKPAAMLKYLHDLMVDWNQNFGTLSAFIDKRVELAGKAKGDKIRHNLSEIVFNDPKNKGRFWGTLMGDRAMKRPLHDHLEDALAEHFDGMSLNLVEIRETHSEEDVWKEYLSTIQAVVMYYGKNPTGGEFDATHLQAISMIDNLKNTMIKFHSCP